MPDPFDFTYISFGAGVQSSTLVAMSALGLRGCPRADVAIFADTQDEPSWVYEQFNAVKAWCETRDLEVRVCSRGKLSEAAIERHNGGRSRFANIPLWTLGKDGREAPLRRQCTREYKIEPIEREVRGMLGFKKGERIAGKKRVRCLIGMSLDESDRTADSRTPWITNEYPLIEARMNRYDCIKLARHLGLPEARKSSCVFCPWHNNAFWHDLKTNYPNEFQKAVEFDRAMRNMTQSGVKNPAFVHRSLKPLDEVDFIDKTQAKLWDLDGFRNECMGMCGV